MKGIKILFLAIITIFTGCDRNYEEELDNEVVGQLLVPLNADKNYIRAQEAPIGNMATDALKFYIEKTTTTKIDIAFVNSGGLRYSDDRVDAIYPVGDFTKAMAKEVYPFNNIMMIMDVTGAQLKEIFEHSVAYLPTPYGSFLQVSKDVVITVDLTKQPEILSTGENPIIETPGERVVSIKIKGVEIDPLSTYTIATSDYIGNGGDRFTTMKKITSKIKTGEDILYSLVAYVKDQTDVNGGATPVIEGRIVIE
ncbi:5'-nucleotidase C-terminal domain-containing protein [bacterium]|nr:5'-nucleotidase C-terminal domain-containing protein [bacterium]